MTPDQVAEAQRLADDNGGLHNPHRRDLLGDCLVRHHPEETNHQYCGSHREPLDEDLSHAALADEGGDVVVGDAGADVQGHSQCRSYRRRSAERSAVTLHR